MLLPNGRLKIVTVGLLVASLAAGCVTSDSVPEVATEALGPHDAKAEVQADLITLEPSQTHPGALISVFFPDERTRGAYYVLESHTGDGWNLEYHLISDWNGGRSPTSHKAESIGYAVDDVGIEGAGPDIIAIPAEAPPGEYRVCTGNSRPNICALLTIQAGA